MWLSDWIASLPLAMKKRGLGEAASAAAAIQDADTISLSHIKQSNCLISMAMTFRAYIC